MNEIIDHTPLREYLLDNGLTPLDATVVIKNKRIRELFQARHLQAIEIKKLQSEVNRLKREKKESTVKKAPKIPKVSKNDVWVEVYPDGDFKRYIIGRFNLKVKLNLLPSDADKFCTNGTQLFNGNYLRLGKETNRTCINCQDVGKVGVLFDIQKTHIDNRCYPCRGLYAKAQREKTKAKVRQAKREETE